MKNLVKSMATYGEMLNKIGSWSPHPLFYIKKFGGYIMKNNMMKNVVKAMAQYGEMQNRIGA